MRQHGTTFNSQIPGRLARYTSQNRGNDRRRRHRSAAAQARRNTECRLTRPATLQGSRSAREKLVLLRPPLKRPPLLARRRSFELVGSRKKSRKITFDEWEPCSYRARRDYVKKRCHTDRHRGSVYSNNKVEALRFTES